MARIGKVAQIINTQGSEVKSENLTNSVHFCGEGSTRLLISSVAAVSENQSVMGVVIN
jgi:hypothetical protein